MNKNDGVPKYTAEQMLATSQDLETYNTGDEYPKTDDVMRLAQLMLCQAAKNHARIAELAAEVAAGDLAVAQADRTIERLISHSKDSYVPTDAEVSAWMRRNDIDESHIKHWRMAINDARSMHAIDPKEATP